jgi:hypothetical protein
MKRIVINYTIVISCRGRRLFTVVIPFGTTEANAQAHARDFAARFPARDGFNIQLRVNQPEGERTTEIDPRQMRLGESAAA